MRSYLYIAVVISITMLEMRARAEVVKQRLRVGNHVDTVAVSNATIDSGFSQATLALALDAGVDDLSCNLVMQRWGAQTTFSAGDDVVDNYDQYMSILNTANVAVAIVDVLNWCWVPGTWGGCGYPVGANQPFILTRAAAVNIDNGIFLAHEFLHTLGYDHVFGHQWQIIAENAGINNTRIWESNMCTEYKSDYGCWPQGWLCSVHASARAASSEPGLGAVLSTELPPRPVGATAPLRPPTNYDQIAIEELASAPLLDVLPVEAEDYYTANDVAFLRKLVADRSTSYNRRTVLALLGLIGTSQEDARSLMNYLSAGGGEEADLSAASMALGYLVNRVGSQDGLDFLIASANDSDDYTAQSAVLGLAVSGEPRAASELDALASRRGKLSEALLELAIDANATISRVGLRRYYGLP